MLKPTKLEVVLVSVATYCLGMGAAFAASSPVSSSDSLICFALGLTGAACISAWLERIDNNPKTYAVLLLSMLIAGFSSPILAKMIASKYGQEYGFSESDLAFVIPLIIGVIVPFVIPLGAVYFTNKYGKDSQNG